MIKMDYKLKGNIAGYIAVVLMIIILVLSTYLTVMDVHFKCDVFVMILLVSIMGACRDTYLDYRKREIEEMNI